MLQDSRDAMSHQGHAPVEDDDIAHAVSLSLKVCFSFIFSLFFFLRLSSIIHPVNMEFVQTAEQEKAKHELEGKETSGLKGYNLTAGDDPGKATSSNRR